MNVCAYLYVNVCEKLNILTFFKNVVHGINILPVSLILTMFLWFVWGFFLGGGFRGGGGCCVQLLIFISFFGDTYTCNTFCCFKFQRELMTMTEYNFFFFSVFSVDFIIRFKSYK